MREAGVRWEPGRVIGGYREHFPGMDHLSYVVGQMAGRGFVFSTRPRDPAACRGRRLSKMRRADKKWLVAVVSIALVATSVGVALAGNQAVRIVVNDRVINPDVLPRIVEDRVMVPVRAVAEALGAQVYWDAGTRTVRVSSVGGDAQGAEPTRIGLLEAAVAPQSAVECAVRWAEAMMNRNGALQYAVSAPSLRAKGAPASWVTGVSSPWVDGYEVSFRPEDITDETGKLRVRLFMWTSAGSAGAGAEDVEVKHFPDMQGSPWLVTGSRGGEGSFAGDKEQSPPAGDFVPFLAIEKPVKLKDLNTYPVRRASWDLKNGILALGDTWFEFKDENKRGFARFAWDGGERIALTPEPGDGLDLVVKGGQGTGTAGAAAKLVRLSSSFDMVSLPDTGEEILIVRRPGLEEPYELEIRTGAEVKRLSLVPGLGSGTSLLRPVGLESFGDGVKMYFETTVDRGGETQGCGLVEAIYSGGRIAWRVISTDLDIHEAGAGTRMVKAGDAIYIGRQEGTVLKVDIATGKCSPCPEIDQALSLFSQRYANRTECCTPAGLYEYGDILVVDYEPAALREDVLDNGLLNDTIAPVRCVLAVRDGEVVGRIMVVGERTLVVKGDRVTQTIVSPSEVLPRWVFPIN